MLHKNERLPVQCFQGIVIIRLEYRRFIALSSKLEVGDCVFMGCSQVKLLQNKIYKVGFVGPTEKNFQSVNQCGWEVVHAVLLDCTMLSLSYDLHSILPSICGLQVTHSIYSADSLICLIMRSALLPRLIHIHRIEDIVLFYCSNRIHGHTTLKSTWHFFIYPTFHYRTRQIKLGKWK